MARNIATVLLLVGAGSCMKMRETVERTVMVRTTGSDLQPAATGYIYKKESDGPESVVKMGETEIMEHLSKLYEQPHSYAAPIPVAHGPFNSKEEDDKSASHVIPVVENQEGDEHIAGIADEDYGKMFDGYANKYGEYNSDFAEYLKSIGHFDDDGYYHTKGGGSDYGLKGHHTYGEKGNKGFGIKNHYEKGGVGAYHKGTYGGFTESKKGGHNKHYDEADEYGKDYAKGHGYKGGDHAHKKDHDRGDKVEGFHKVYDKHEDKKDHDFYDGAAHRDGFYKHDDNHKQHGSDAASHEEGGAHKSGHVKGGYGKSGVVEKESGDDEGSKHTEEESGESGHRSGGNFGAKEGKYAGKSYGYEIKH